MQVQMNIRAYQSENWLLRQIRVCMKIKQLIINKIKLNGEKYKKISIALNRHEYGKKKQLTDEEFVYANSANFTNAY